MTGTILNVAGILIGGVLGLTLPGLLSTRRQLGLKNLLGFATVFMGIQIMWVNMGGGFGRAVQQFLIVMISMSAGRLLGRLMGLQKGMNRLGGYAGARFALADRTGTRSVSEGFITATILFCIAPLGMVGAILDGTGHWGGLAIKTLLDGLATMAFVVTFGWGVLLAILPVLAWQGTLSLATRLFEAQVGNDLVMASLAATCGMMVMSLSMVILDLKKVELADYLPSLVLAPLITWFWFPA